jgi:OOP family OmpA-OmpF porin|tara:strand:+ start:734 stop:1690 length:957 start_codon:yes stop_codon:yes gene_type:complete
MLNYLEKKCHFYLLFLVILIGNGCAYFDIEELKSTPKSNNEFAQALSESYLEFALYEMNEMHDEMDASYFAKKGINARKNIDISPELINNWDIDDEYIEIVNNKRKELIFTLNTERAALFPKLSARTQLGFDCWLEQLEEGWQTEHIKKCYDMMNTGLITLANDINHNTDVVEKVNSIKSNKNKENDIEEAKNIKEIKKIDDVEKKLKFEIYFAHNIYKLNNETKITLKDIKNTYNITNNFIIEVVGHTDRSGTDEYNILLSKLRSNEVKKYLTSLGIDNKNITSYYYGESRPKIVTADGVREKINRRVEIFLNDNKN